MFALATLALAACFQPSLRGPDLGGLYNRAAREGHETRNPIIVIPGVLGSRLREPNGGTIRWGAFVPLRRDGAAIALPLGAGEPLADLRDGLEADAVLDRVRVSWLRLSVEQKAYFHLLSALGAGGYRDELLGLAGAIDYGDNHFTCFQFAYDWRRDNVENAKRLHAFMLEKRAYVEAERERRFGITNGEVRFDIVAHSMGGLLTRYYLRYGDADLADAVAAGKPSWAGAELVERAVLVATPNAGSVDALRRLLEGQRFAWLLPHYSPAVLGTMPALYQLLPRPRHRRVVAAEDAKRALDLYDPLVWEAHGWGLAAADSDAQLAEVLPEIDSPSARRELARDHLAKSLARAKAFATVLDVPAELPAGLGLHLIAGDAVPTDAVLAVGQGAETRVLERLPGDGIVVRQSAVMDERAGREWQPGVASPIDWSRVMFLFTDHLGMTRDPAFTDNLLYVLLEEPR